jgi:hypothetical protein
MMSAGEEQDRAEGLVQIPGDGFLIVVSEEINDPFLPLELFELGKHGPAGVVTITGAIHYRMCCGNGGIQVFLKMKTDDSFFHSILEDLLKIEYLFFVWFLMDNHFHLQKQHE